MAEEQKEVIDFEEEERTAISDDSMEELELEDLETSWIRNPKVGEEVVLDIKKVYKDRNIKARTKEGRDFSTALSGVDYKITLEMKDGKRYSPSAWEVWGKIRRLMLQEGTKEIKVKVKHIRDGQQTKDDKDNYEVTLIK